MGFVHGTVQPKMAAEIFASVVVRGCAVKGERPQRTRGARREFLVGELRKLEEAVMRSAEEVSPLSDESRVFIDFVLFCVYARARFSDAAKVRTKPFFRPPRGRRLRGDFHLGRPDEDGPNCKASPTYSSPCRPGQGIGGRVMGRSMAQAPRCAVNASRVRRSAHARAQSWWRLERRKIDDWRCARLAEAGGVPAVVQPHRRTRHALLQANTPGDRCKCRNEFVTAPFPWRVTRVRTIKRSSSTHATILQRRFGSCRK